MKKAKRDYKAWFAANPFLAEAAAKPVPEYPKRKYKAWNDDVECCSDDDRAMTDDEIAAVVERVRRLVPKGIRGLFGQRGDGAPIPYKVPPARSGRGRPINRDVLRNAFIADMIDSLLADYPGLHATREEPLRDTEPPTSACAIVAKALNISEVRVEEINREQHTG